MADYRQQWDNALLNIQKRLNAEGRGNEFDDWFRPIVFESFDKDACRLLLQVPSSSHSEHIENNYLKILAYELIPIFGKRLSLAYRITVDRQNNQTVLEEQQREMVKARATGNKKTSELQEVDSHLDPRLNFRNFIEGESNKLSRSVGITVAEHPRNTKFNPMFIYGASGVGKTHLTNAIGVRAKELYPNLRILY